MTDDPKVRAEKVLRGGMIFLGVLAVVGMVALLFSLPDKTENTATGEAAPSINIKQQKRASAAAARVAAGIAAWGRRVSVVCDGGKSNYPNIVYGFDTNLNDMAYAVDNLVRGVNGVQQPQDQTAKDQLLPLRTQGEELAELWRPLGKRDKNKVKPEEKAAAVDKVRTYVQVLIDRGGKSCQALLPRPNPPLPSPTPATPIAPAATPTAVPPAAVPPNTVPSNTVPPAS